MEKSKYAHIVVAMIATMFSVITGLVMILSKFI